MNFWTWVSMLSLHFAAAASPGPDFAIVFRNSLQHSRMKGLATALGIVVSNLAHIILCLLGMHFILKNSLIFNLFCFWPGDYICCSWPINRPNLEVRPLKNPN